MKAWIIMWALGLPFFTISVFPPPTNASFVSSWAFVIWLAIVGGFAGYGMGTWQRMP